jgi:hypothetical protein
MKLKCLSLGLLFLFKPSFSIADSCATAKIISGLTCKDVRVEFNLEKCGGPSEIVKAKCASDGPPTALIKYRKITYSVTFKEGEEVWGVKPLTLAGDVTEKVSSKKNRAPSSFYEDPFLEMNNPSKSKEPQATPTPLPLPPAPTPSATVSVKPTVPAPAPAPSLTPPPSNIPQPSPTPSVSPTPTPSPAPTPTGGPLVLIDSSFWKLTFSGFIEIDLIRDSVRSFNEGLGNSPVDRGDTANGANGRTQLSVRNSRFAFNIETPPVGRWKNRAYLEMDFLGFDPPPGANNSESSFANNPTLRLRHAFFQSSDDTGITFLAGQTWQLFGWQPFYLSSAIEVQPIPAGAFGREAQFRLMKTFSFTSTTSIQSAIALLRPPRRDSGYPDIQTGVRIVLGSRTSGYTGSGSAPQKPQPMSVGFSTTIREFSVPISGGKPADHHDFMGSAWALNALIPIIASCDGKDPGNTLSLLGEFTQGKGYGDLFGGWTGNMANPLSTSTLSPAKSLNMDAGIGDYDAAGNFQLVQLNTFNLQAQYHLPSETKTWITLGAGQLYSSNMNFIVQKNGLTSGDRVPYNRQQIEFINTSHQLSQQVRINFEFDHVKTFYADQVHAQNNRYQLGILYMF